MRVSNTAVLCFLLASTDAFTLTHSFLLHKRSSCSTNFSREVIISSDYPSEKRSGLLLPSKSRLNYASTTLPDSSDPYVILNLDPSSVDLKEIKKAYRKMALLYHPDARDEADKKVANEEFARVNAAYALLTGKSDEMSKAYDQSSAQSKKPKKTQWKDNSDAYRRVRINWGDDEYPKAKTADSRVYSDQNYSNWWARQETVSAPSPDNVQGFDIHGNPVNRPRKPNHHPSTRAYHSPSGVKGTGFNDFAVAAQVREYDSNGYPKVKENDRIGKNYGGEMHAASNSYATYGSYTSKSNPDFSIPKVPSPDNVLGFDIHGNPVVRTAETKTKHWTSNSKSSTFRDFAANAQVRDYDVNGNPIDNSKDTASSHPNKSYSTDQCMHSPSNASASNAFIQDFVVRTKEYSHTVSGNPVGEGVVNRREKSTEQPTNTSHLSNQSDNYLRDFSKYAQVRNYDMNGNPVAESSVERHHKRNYSGDAFRVNDNASKENMQHRYSDYSTKSNFSSTVGNTQYKEHPPSPDNVQRYDIYGNPIERNPSIEHQERDKMPSTINEIKSEIDASTSKSKEKISSENLVTPIPKSSSFSEPTPTTQSYTNNEDPSRSHNKIRTASADYDKRMDEFDKWMQELDSESSGPTADVNTRTSSAKTIGRKPRKSTSTIPHDVMNQIHLEDIYQKERYSNQNCDPSNPTIRSSSKTSSKSTNAYLHQYEKYTSQDPSKKTSPRNDRKKSAEEDLPSFLTSIDDQESQNNPRMMSKIYDFFFPKASYVN
jgi:curved DNA-binding protein CbpA